MEEHTTTPALEPVANLMHTATPGLEPVANLARDNQQDTQPISPQLQNVAINSREHKRTIPKRIFGLRRTTFWLAFALALVVLAAAIAGGIAGGLAARNRKDNVPPSLFSDMATVSTQTIIVSAEPTGMATSSPSPVTSAVTWAAPAPVDRVNQVGLMFGGLAALAAA